jgi:hypothetical protein
MEYVLSSVKAKVRYPTVCFATLLVVCGEEERDKSEGPAAACCVIYVQAPAKYRGAEIAGLVHHSRHQMT